MDIKLKKCNLFRNITWVILFFSLTVTVILGTETIGEYRSHKNPYSDLKFVSDMENLDSILKRCLYILDEDGEINEEYVKSQIQSENKIRQKEYESELDELKSTNIKADTEKEYEELMELYKNQANERYENDLKLIEERIKDDAKYAKDDFKIVSKRLKNLQFFIKDNQTGKVLTNTSIKDVEKFAVSKENEDEYEFLIQSGLDPNLYTYMNDNGKSLSGSIVEPSNEDVIKIYKADKNIIQHPEDYIYQAKIQSKTVMETVNRAVIMFGIFLAIAATSAIYLYKTRTTWGNDFEILNKIYRKIYLEIVFIPIIAICIFVFVLENIILGGFNYNVQMPSDTLTASVDWYGIIIYGSLATVICILIYITIMNITKKKAEGKVIDCIKNHSLIVSLIRRVKNLYLNSNGKKIIILNFIISIICISFTVLSFFRSDSSFDLIGNMILILYLIVVMIYLSKMDKYMRNIYLASSRIRQGDFHQTIKEDGPAILRLTAENLNNIKDGLENAINSATRNERLKTELITNVSHDLKTPLTSIINYIDLLKDENASDEEKKKYIDIIDKKSERLKVLIEDLFEASKVASKTIELNMEKVDMISLVRQTLGEFEEKIVHSNLKFIVKLPKEKAYVNIDGKKTWRVLENLLSNILKYSMDDTRVYIEVEEIEENISVVMRNISAFEMDFTGEDILERFKRGDGSRHTEGSGLGLSIAKSLTELQNGNFNINIDGDLFKVTVAFKKYENDIKTK